MKDVLTLLKGDCLERMKEIPDGSVDMVLTDPPYGTTACSWDSVIPFEPMWTQLKRITKKNGAVVMTASQPFTSALVMSNPKDFKYDWIWEKNTVTGFANAKKQPLRNYENAVVFGNGVGALSYFPQGLLPLNKVKKNGKSVGGDTLRSDVSQSSGKGALRTAGAEYVQEHTNYPRQIIKINSEKNGSHPTQKPVALMEYLIKTYTNPNETVLDFTMGSGTTGVAAMNLGRKFIGIELDDKYFAIAEERIKQAFDAGPWSMY